MRVALGGELEPQEYLGENWSPAVNHRSAARGGVLIDHVIVRHDPRAREQRRDWKRSGAAKELLQEKFASDSPRHGRQKSSTL